jgi:hypothetical protein
VPRQATAHIPNVGGQFKKRQKSNNPKLTELMNEDLTFKQLKDREFKLKKQRLELTAKQSSMNLSKRWYKEDYNQEEFDKLSNEIYQIDDLMIGIKSKIREKGFEYEYVIQERLPTTDGEIQIWNYIWTIILEKNYLIPLKNDDLIEFIISINKKKDDELISVRKIKK